MDIPFTETEKRFVLAEVIKSSRVSLDAILEFIDAHKIHPNFGDLCSPPGRTPNQVYTIYQELSNAGGAYKHKGADIGGLLQKKQYMQTNGQGSPAVTKIPKTPKTPAVPTTNGNTPATSDGELKRKRGRPSKADLAARAAQSGQGVAPSALSAAPVANMMGAGGAVATPPAKRRGRPTKAEVLMRQTIATAQNATQVAADANTEDPEQVAVANETIDQADEAMEVMEAAGDAGTEDAAHEVDDEAHQETHLQKGIMDEEPDFA